MLKIALTLMAVASLGLASKLKTPENQWVKPGDATVLRCEATSEVTSCSWSTSYGEVYLMGVGNTAENGRLSYASTNKNECAIKVDQIETKDHGKWTCLLGFTNGLEVTSERGNFNVNLATRPSSVWLEDPFNDMANATLEEINQFRCVVENAIPKPVFNWFVDEEQLKDIKVKTAEDEKNTYTQTLYYEPRMEHSNKTLRCVIDHAGFELEDEREASITLKFTEDLFDKMISNELDAEDSFSTKDITNGIIVVMCGVFFVCLVVLVAFKCGILCFKPRAGRTEVDAEKNNPGTPEKAEKTDAIKETDEGEGYVKRSLSERFSSFFRVNRSFTLDDEKASNAGEPTEADKLVEDIPVGVVVMDNKDAEQKVDSEPASTEEKVDHVEKADKKAKAANNRFVSFVARIFRARDTVADKEEVKPISMSDIERVEDVDEKKGHEEIVPEDTAKETEQEATPNTSF